MDKLVELIRNTKNKGKTHVFLGSPYSDGWNKTTVEPGNNFSPGIGSCGISVWTEVGGEFYSPDILEDKEIKWGFEGGVPPVLESFIPAGDSLKVSGKLAYLGSQGPYGTDYCEVRAEASGYVKAALNLVIRDIGPAGARINSLIWDDQIKMLDINGEMKLYVEQSCARCTIVPEDHKHDSPIAIITCPFEIDAGGVFLLSFKVRHGIKSSFGIEASSNTSSLNISVKDAMDKSREEWRSASPVKVFAPDGRIQKTWERCIFHMLSAMECSIPRIGAVNYPHFWMRDGVIILRALDLIGRHDLARTANDYVAPLIFSGGFGAESDAPGEGIWALVSHGRITGDRNWLESVFPYILERAQWIERMLKADKPLRAMGENRMPKYLQNAAVNVLCLPSKNGTIHGRMDWHSPDFYINCWAEMGLRLTSWAASMLGRRDLCQKYGDLAMKLHWAITEYLLPEYGNDRDLIVTPYPTGTVKDAIMLRDKFYQLYREYRLTEDGHRKPEGLWTYFEAAQIHNAMLFGLKDMAWTNLYGMLEEDIWNVSAYTEGSPGGNEYLPFKNDEGIRGWLDKENALGGNMPHNWTCAEMINLIRDIFIVEEGDTLCLGKGVPKEWLKPGSSFGVMDMPTDFGKVSYKVTVDNQGTPHLSYNGAAKYKLCI